MCKDCSDVDAVLICCCEQRPELESLSVNLPENQHSQPQLWLKLWTATKRMKLLTRVVEMSFLRMVSWISLRDGVSGSEMLLLHMKRIQDACWTPQRWNDMSKWKEVWGEAQEGLHLSPGLKIPWCPTSRAGRGGWIEESLGFSDTDKHQRWMDGWKGGWMDGWPNQ